MSEQLDLFAAPKPPRRPKKPRMPAPPTNVVKIVRRQGRGRRQLQPATVAVLPPRFMRSEVAAAARSMLEVPPLKWPEQRRRCAKVFADLLAGVPEATRRKAVADFLAAVDVQLSRNLMAGSGGAA
jgi:hypothetical protein